ncbi:MAK10-like protein [Tanacetum coccineum]
MKKAFKTCCRDWGEVNPTHAYYNGSCTSKDTEDPSWSTSFKTRRTEKTSSALEALWKTLFVLYLYLIGTLKPEESWTLLVDPALYDNESWNDPMDFAKPVKAISFPQDVSSTSDRHLIELEKQVQCLMEAHLALIQSNFEGLVSNFMVSQDARLSKFETDLKQQQSEMTNKMDTVLKAITDRIAGALPNNTVKNSKLNVNTKTSVLSAHKYMESLELGKNGSTFIQGEVSAKIEDPELFTLPCRLGDSKPFDTLADLGSCVNIILLYLFKKLNIELLEETDHSFGLADGTKSYPVRIVKDVEVRIGNLKLLNDFYVIDMKKDLKTSLLVGRRFLETANAVIDYRKAKIAVGKGITRRMVEFLGALPINLKRNMWESKYLIENLINWDKPPKDGDGAWHAKIRIIDPDEEEFTKTLQSTPTTRKISERESQKEIINLDHFYDT